MVVAFTTEWLAPETTSQVVSAPEASSPAALVEAPSHSVQTLDLTYLSAEHKVLSHAVFAPLAGSPAALVVPAAHATQALEETYSLAAQSVAGLAAGLAGLAGLAGAAQLPAPPPKVAVAV